MPIIASAVQLQRRQVTLKIGCPGIGDAGVANPKAAQTGRTPEVNQTGIGYLCAIEPGPFQPLQLWQMRQPPVGDASVAEPDYTQASQWRQGRECGVTYLRS